MRGRVQNIFLTLANHEALAKRWMVFANHILHKSKLSPRDREILILRVGWLCQSGYEWGQHVLIGQKAGLSDLEIEAIKVGPSDRELGDSGCLAFNRRGRTQSRRLYYRRNLAGPGQLLLSAAAHGSRLYGRSIPARIDGFKYLWRSVGSRPAHHEVIRRA